MKKTFIYIAFAAAAFIALPSCNDLLEKQSPSTTSDEIVYSNYTLAEQTIFSIHQTMVEQNSYRGRFLPWYGFNTDIEWYNDSKDKDTDKTGISSYDIRVNNAQLNDSKNPYADIYSGIERANLAIEGLRTYGNVKGNADMAYLLGEALTLRAMLYYDLTKAWGDVPARFEHVTLENMYQPKASRDVIFNQILSDLEEAIPYLPYPKGSTQTQKVDRVNKIFAEGLYARIALAAAGYALRPDDGKVGTGDAGTVRLSSDANLTKAVLYPKALVYLKDAIQSGKASLVADYKTLWYNVNNFDLEAGNELLFCLPFGDEANKVRGRWNYTFAVKNENATILGNTFKQGGVAGPTPNFWFKFEENDVRRDLTCVNYKWNQDNLQEPAGINAWYFGKYRFDWMLKHPYNGGNDDGVKPVVMRYSDILLMAAEIANEVNNGPDAFAKECFLAVRQRAFKGNESEAETFVNGLSGKDAFFNAIVDERAFEFCGEFLRKADLIRWNLLGSKMAEEKTDLRALAERTGAYSFLNGTIWYRENEDQDAIEIRGFKAGETSNPGEGWTEVKDYISLSKFKAEKIDFLYINDPDTQQFWPIFQKIIDNSQKTLVNDYGF